MAEVLHRYEDRVVAEDGTTYQAQVCGRERKDGLWEGWIEFLPVGAGTALRSARESTQPNRRDLLYWSEGLSSVYLEGSLERTLRLPPTGVPAAPDSPAFSGPAPDPERASAPVAILDPFSVYAKGRDLLRKELGALDAWHLRNIARAYHLADERKVDVDAAERSELVDLIVSAVAEQSTAGAGGA